MNAQLLDLRSDTLSMPSEAMRRVMAEAPVGDSFYDEDPSVTQLEQMVSRLFGHEAALFVPSGTMSNQIALQLHCRPGEAVLAAPDLHILRAESGGISALAGIQPMPVSVDDDFLPNIERLDDVFVGQESIVSPPTRLLVVENTHLFSGGRIHPLDHLQQLADWCHQRKIAFHLDGARLWHAHVETGVELSVYGSLFQTLSVCFSKGLGAPAGSCLVGSHAYIQRAKLIRKRLGGTMRQCGILAAGAQHALKQHLHELRKDHQKAKALADWLQKKYPDADVPTPETNIVILKFKNPASDVMRDLEKRYGLRLSALNTKTLRAVCYRDISSDDLERRLNG